MGKLFRWEHGRQGGGYSKLTLVSSKLLKLDLHLIRFPPNTRAKWHTDSAPEGYEHHRINVTLRRPRVGCGGLTLIYDRNYVRPWLATKRIYYFRPDLQRHTVTEVRLGSLLLLSLGWLRKKR